MRFTAYLCLAIALAGATVANAQSKKKAPKPTLVQRKDTSSFAPPTRLVSDSEYSYAKGITHTEGLGYYLESQHKLYDEHRPMVAEGVRMYYATAPEKKSEALALAAGLEAGTMTITEMIPHFNKIITGTDTATYISNEAFFQGYVAQGMGDKVRYTSEQARQVVARQDQYLRLQKAKASYDEHLAYVATNSAYKPLTDGIYYRVLTKGKGALPKADSRVKVNYEGRLLDGKVFDSSYQRGEPIVFGLNQVIQGWGLALQKMPVGSTWEVVIPQELAYGERGAGADIPPYSSLVFKIELIGIEK